MTHRLFIYGTLLPGLCRHSVMQGAQHISAGKTMGCLYDLGPYPALFLQPTANDVEPVTWVRGELYEVSDALLTQLDSVEAYVPTQPENSEYVRETVWVESANGTQVQAWTYVYNQDLSQAQRIAHGDYVRHLKEAGYTPTW